MEVIQQLQALSSSGYSVAVAATAILAVLFKMFTQWVRAMEWHEKHFVRKRLTRLKAIRSSAESNSLLTQYLDEAIELEAFRIASGITTSRAKMEFLLRLAQDGLWSREQIRRIAKFLTVKPGHPEPQLKILWLDRVAAYLGASAAIMTLILGLIYLFKFMLIGKPLLLLVGLLLFILCVLAALLFATDTLSYLVATRVQRHLQRTRQSA